MGGWLLVSLIVLMMILSITFIGIVRLLVEHIRTTGLRSLETKAYYLAQAGAMEALYDYRDSSDGLNAFDLGTDVVVEDDPSSANDDSYRLLAQAGDGLLVNMKSARFVTSSIPSSCTGSTRDRFTTWRLRNAIGTGSVVIDQVAVDWSPVLAGERVSCINFNGNKVWPTGATNCSSSPNGTANQWLDLSPNFTVAAGGGVINNTVWFTTTGFRQAATESTTKDYIDFKFLMTDGTTRTARFVNTVANRQAQCSLTAIGRALRGPLPFGVCRRVWVAYDICSAAVLRTDCETTGQETRATGRLAAMIELPGGCP